MNAEYWGNNALQNTHGLAWAEQVLKIPNLRTFLANGLDSPDLHEQYAAAFMLVLACPYWLGDVRPLLEKALERVKAIMQTPPFLAHWPDRPLILTALVKLAGHLRWRLGELADGEPFEVVGGPDDMSESFRRVLAARMQR